jgi:FlaA1/EpsC-like NDP-sugar epimerase
MIRKYFFNRLNKYASKWIILAIDVVLVCLSFILAYFIRFNASFEFDLKQLYFQLPVVLVISLVSFLLVGSYKGIIRHTGIRDVFNVFLGVTLLGIITFSLVFLNRIFKVNNEFTIPISIIIIHYFVNVFSLTLSRFIFKSFFEIINSELGEVTNVLIYGAGDSGIITYGALNKDSKNNYEVVGFIDDDKNKIGKKIDRVKIFELNKISGEFLIKK